VGKCLEQGLMEVMEEEELAAMRAHQQHYEQVCRPPPPASLLASQLSTDKPHCHLVMHFWLGVLSKCSGQLQLIA